LTQNYQKFRKATDKFAHVIDLTAINGAEVVTILLLPRTWLDTELTKYTRSIRELTTGLAILLKVQQEPFSVKVKEERPLPQESTRSNTSCRAWETRFSWAR